MYCMHTAFLKGYLAIVVFDVVLCTGFTATYTQFTSSHLAVDYQIIQMGSSLKTQTSPEKDLFNSFTAKTSLHSI